MKRACPGRNLRRDGAARSRLPFFGAELCVFATTLSFPRHAHDEYGVGLIVAGAQTSWSGRGEVEAVAGDMISVNPGEIHDGASLGGAARRWRMIYFDPDGMRRLFADDVRGDVEFAAPQLRDHSASARLAEAFAARDGLEFEGALLSALAPLLARRRAGSAASPAIARARQRIDDDPASRVRLGELAAEADLSRFQFLRAFAREVGATPQAYARQARARLARRLVRSGLGLAEAAVAAGFADQAHMTRALAGQFLLTPGAMR